jgi:hypothetical protein
MPTATRKRRDSTGSILRRMLVENTGMALCDSGGRPKFDESGKYAGSEYGYGRNHERNRGRDFDREPEVSLSIDKHGIDFTYNVYHWLKSRLSFDAAMDRRFRRFANRPDHAREPGLVVAEAFPDWLRERGERVTGLYGDGQKMVVNTYNGDDLLGQTIQYVYFEIDGTAYVALQIHGGADVRAGYTFPRIFRIDDDGANMFSNADASIYCDGDTHDAPGQLTLSGEPIYHEPHNWRTDDSYHWYYDGCSAGVRLEDYPRVLLPDGMTARQALESQPETLFYDSDGHGYCPKCGARLHGGC